MTMKIAHRLAVTGIVFMFGSSVSSGFAADAQPGKAVYTSNCQSCHGADGKGNAAMAKALGDKGLNLTSSDVKAMSDDDLMKIIADGRGKMPAYGKKLNKQQQTDVLAYTRSLAK
jgi:mono/diheme cytochrome c family protein